MHTDPIFPGPVTDRASKRQRPGFTFQRHKQAAYLNPTVEFSATLGGAWTTAQHNVNATIVTTDAGSFETITVTIPKNGLPTLFARLKVMQPAP